ncbi:MAG: AAA family ATPase [Planctomycetota bacterium]
MNGLLGQGSDYERLLAQARCGRMPHGVLICGGRGVGKTTAALELAAVLLQDEARVRTHAHPDLHVLQVPEDKEDIPVELVRELRDDLLRRPLAGGARVVILDPADRLNEQGQNALLKTLEEPGRRCFLLLPTRRPEALLPTVRSRVTVLRLRPLAAGELARALAAEGLGSADERAWAAAVARGSLGVARELLAQDLKPIFDRLEDFVGAPRAGAQLARAMLDGIRGRQASVERARLVLFLLRQIARSCAFPPEPPQGLGKARGEPCGELPSTLAAVGLGAYPAGASELWTDVLDRLFVAEEDLDLRLAPEPVLATALLDLAELLGRYRSPSHP